MSCSCSPAAETLRDEYAELAPAADTASNGCCASAQHTAQNPTSGHEAGLAWDQDADLGPGAPTMAEITSRLAMNMLAGLVPQCDYVIYNRRIFNPEIAPWWRPYSGSNPHESHAHHEVNPSHRNYRGSWHLAGGGVLAGEQADRIEQKLDTLLEITAKRGALARLNARVRALLRRERSTTEANARGAPRPG